MRLEGRRAVITGAGRGIGRAMAMRFAAEGAVVCLTARKSKSVVDVASAIRTAGGSAFAMAWDVSEFDTAAERLEEARGMLGGLDILVNNAGVVRIPADHPDPTPETAWDYTLDINLKGLYFVCEAAAPLMEAAGGGVIINMASDAGMRGAPNPYGISKWGVIGYTKGLAVKLASKGIRVNGIAPGPVATGMMNCPDEKPRDWPAGPLGRFSLPEEIADVAIFLASDDSRAVFGHTIVVNSANG
jgi:3-oxoacyl-[acyl-carrier protein] reductase